MIFNIISNREWEYGQVTVTIKGATTTSTYDAANHSASGYTVTISDPNYKTTDFSFTGTASATGKNAGTYYMGMTSAQFVNNNPRFRNVVFSVTDGYVSISRKAVTVKADNKSKTYGQSDPTLTATVTGTLGSDTVTYSLSRASGSNVGSYTITATGNATQGNYSVTYQTGTLTINKAAASALGLSVSGGTYTYNGTGRSISASVSVTSGTTIQYSTDNTNWSNTNPSYKNAGTYKVYARAVNSNYNTATGNANVVINPASCTLTANSGTKTYNKNSQSVTGFTSSPSGLSFSGVSASGSGTNAGSYSVTFSGVTVNTTKDTTGNYKVTGTTNGTLTINPASCTLTANSGTKTYNGSSQSVTGFTSSPSGLSFSGVSASGSGTNAGSYNVNFSGVTVNTTKDTTGNYLVTAATKGTLTINKAAASALGLTVTNYSGYYDGNGHSITARTTVTSGTTIQYRTSTTAAWSNTNPTRSAVGTTTVYVRAVNSNYNTASATGTITISQATLTVNWPVGTNCFVSQGEDNIYVFPRDTYPAGTTSISLSTKGLWSATASSSTYAGQIAGVGATSVTSIGNKTLTASSTSSSNPYFLFPFICDGTINTYNAFSNYNIKISDIPYAQRIDPTIISKDIVISGQTYPLYFGIKYPQSGTGYYGVFGNKIDNTYAIYDLSKYVLHVDYENTGSYSSGGVDNCLCLYLSNTMTNPYTIPVGGLIPLTGNMGSKTFALKDYGFGQFTSLFWCIVSRASAAGYIKKLYFVEQSS